MLLEDFSDGVETRWRYVSDRVMGGVSDGGAVIGDEDGARFALLAGTVSTDNNGGFIQLRHDLRTALPPDSTGITLRVRGQNSPYFVHIRTRDTRRPWQFYQAAFPVSEDWTDVTLDWQSFAAKSSGLPATFEPTAIVSIGLAAYGRDHDAQLAVKTVAVTQD